jgi:hypothetical protein
MVLSPGVCRRCHFIPSTSSGCKKEEIKAVGRGPCNMLISLKKIKGPLLTLLIPFTTSPGIRISREGGIRGYGFPGVGMRFVCPSASNTRCCVFSAAKENKSEQPRSHQLGDYNNWA